MSTIKHPTLGSYVLPPLQIDSINIAPLTTDSMASLTSSSITNITLSGTGGGGTGGSYTYGNAITGITGMGSANVTWGTGNGYTFPNTISINNPNTYSNPGSIQIKGDAEFEGKIKVGGKDLVELLTKIEDKLAIYKPNPELEERWEELRELSKRYKELETEIKEKEKVWDILKK